jgi:hypothetical protein
MTEPRRRRRALTPMSGELRLREADVGLGVERRGRRPRRQRGSKPPPTTWRGAIALGVRRFAAILAIVSVLIAVAALLLVWLAETDTARTFTLAFYLAGVGLLAGAFFSTAAPMDTDHWHDVPQRSRVISDSFVYVALGLCLVGIGAFLDVVA